MVDEFGFEWEKYREEQRYWTELRNALALGIKEHNAKVKAEQGVKQVAQTPEKRKPGRPKGSKNKGGTK